MFPAFDFVQHIIAPWRDDADTWFGVFAMGFLVTATCGLVGNYLILRRLSLVGDAISHSVLPGLAIAYLLARNLNPAFMMLGAVAAGMVTTLLIEVIHSRSRVKTDAAIGITFCTLFAIGVILINVFAGKIHLDADCVLYGELSFVPLEEHVVLLGLDLGPAPIALMLGVFLLVVVLILLFYKELLLTSFDAYLADSLGFSPRLVHYALMGLLSVVVVGAFEAVGAILVVAMLILPGATAQLLSQRLPVIHLLAVIHAFLSALLGLHLGLWSGCPTAATMVVAGSFLFALAWMFSPTQGLLTGRFRKIREGDVPPEVADVAEPVAGTSGHSS